MPTKIHRPAHQPSSSTIAHAKFPLFSSMPPWTWFVYLGCISGNENTSASQQAASAIVGGNGAGADVRSQRTWEACQTRWVRIAGAAVGRGMSPCPHGGCTRCQPPQADRIDAQRTSGSLSLLVCTSISLPPFKHTRYQACAAERPPDGTVWHILPRVSFHPSLGSSSRRRSRSAANDPTCSEY
jgi:hypothetical protein